MMVISAGNVARVEEIRYTQNCGRKTEREETWNAYT
jgi:hypothetical protein